MSNTNNNNQNMVELVVKGEVKMNKENRMQHFDQLTAGVIMKCDKQFKSKKQYNVVSIKFEKNRNDKERYDFIEKTVVAFGNNDIAEKLTAKSMQKVSTMVKGMKYIRNAKNFLNQIALITLDRDIINRIKLSESKTVYMNRNKTDIFIDAGMGVYKSIVKGEIVKFNKNWIEWFPAVYNTSGMKEDAVFFYKVDTDHEQWLDTMKELIPDFDKELIAAGVKIDTSKATREQRRLGLIKDGYKIKGLKALKLFSRPSLCLTSAVRLGDVPGIAIYKDCFVPEKDGVSTSDGSVFFVNEIMSELFHVPVLEMQKLCIQGRSRKARDKFAATGASKKWVDNFIEENKENIVIIGDSNNVGLLLDDNAVKLHGFEEGDLDVKMLSIAKPGKAETSTQMLTKVVFAGAEQGKLKEVEDYIFNLGKEQLLEESKKKLEEVAKDAPLGSTYYVDVLKQLNPINPVVKNVKLTELQNSAKNRIQKIKFDMKVEFGMLVPDRAAMITAGKEELLSHEPDNIEVFYGKYSVAIGNKKFYLERLEKDLVYSVMNDKDNVDELRDKIDEVKQETKELEEEFGKATMYKYPSASPKEYLKVTLVDSYELCKRVDKMDISDLDKDEIKRGIRFASKGIIMMPNDTLLMNLLAGFDFDADEGFICFDKFIYNMLPNNYFNLELNKESSSRDFYFNINKNLINEVIALQLLLDDNVGKVTVEFTVLINLLIDMLNNSGKAYDTALHFLNEAFGENHQKIEKDYYVSPADRTISPEFVETIIREIMTVEWTKQNVIKFLYDCTLVGRFYQESIIDATKTGEFFKRLIECVTIKLSSRQPITFDDEGVMFREKYDTEDKKKVINKIVDGREINSVDRIITYVEYKDVFARIQDRLIEVYNDEIVKMIDEAFIDYKYSDINVEEMHRVITLINAEIPEAINRLTEIKTIYGVMAGQKIRSMEGADEDTKKMIDDNYNGFMEALSNNVQVVFSKIAESYKELTAYEKGALLLGVSIYNKYDMKYDAYNTNRFAYIMDNASSIAFLIGKETTYRTYGEILHNEGVVKSGDTVNIERGMDVDKKIIIESTYTGEATYIEDGEDSYVMQERSIVDLAEEQKLSKTRIIAVDIRRTKEGNMTDIFNSADLNKRAVLVKDGAIKVYKETEEEGKWKLENKAVIDNISTSVEDSKLRKVKGKIAVTFDKETEPKYYILLV